jgi:hypothetical protein
MGAWQADPRISILTGSIRDTTNTLPTRPTMTTCADGIPAHVKARHLHTGNTESTGKFHGGNLHPRVATTRRRGCPRN